VLVGDDANEAEMRALEVIVRAMRKRAGGNSNH
jgi:hypothetical protein